ncbi:hypothetical protein GE09DRAFT_1230007 [Coniochaeta sp. 2T2.1]|nr:hypothetical protein GE09DRAFT_1230007 [Coniochaeta sp. 2T2.1]
MASPKVSKMILSVIPIFWAFQAQLAFARHIPLFERSVDTPDTVYCGGLEEATIFTYDDVDDGGPGIILQDNDNNLDQPHYYFLYENSRDTHPWKYTLLTPGAQIFLSLCPTFQGRLVRGNPHINLDGGAHNLGTWVELSLEGPPSPNGWADRVSTGFTGDLLTGAPAAVLRGKDDGSLAIAKTVGERASDAAREYELSLLDPMRDATIVEEYTPAIGSGNGRFVVEALNRLDDEEG